MKSYPQPGLFSASGTQALGPSAAGGTREDGLTARQLPGNAPLEESQRRRSRRSVTGPEWDPVARSLLASLSPRLGGLGQGKCCRRSRICLSLLPR